jgi:cytochrome P450
VVSADTYVFDPFAPGFTDNPYPAYRELRAAGPAYEHPLGFWVTSRHEQVSALLRGALSVEERHVVGTMADLNAAMFGEREERAGGLSMLDRDPPVHTRLRHLVSKAFTPRSIAALEPQVIRLVDELLDAMSGTVNLIEALAFPLPFAVISEMMGIPAGSDHTRMRELTGTLVRSLEPVTDPELARQIMDADTELVELCAGIVAAKRANPADDLLTALIRAEDDGDVLNDDELVAQVQLLYIAGHETTVNLIGNGVLALLRHPDQYQVLCDTPEIAGNAVEELLRFDSPVQNSRRITLAPYDADGVTIPKGSFVLAGLGSANHDADHWGPDADQLRLDRPDARGHLSFGAGVHHCLGAALARLEGRIVLERLAERFPTMELAGDVTWNGRINLRGVTHLPVTV